MHYNNRHTKQDIFFHITFFSLFIFDLYREIASKLSHIIFVNCCLFNKYLYKVIQSNPKKVPQLILRNKDPYGSNLFVGCVSLGIKTWIFFLTFLWLDSFLKFYIWMCCYVFHWNLVFMIPIKCFVQFSIQYVHLITVKTITWLQFYALSGDFS